MGLWHCLAQQFRQPTGFLGLLAGFFFRINLEGIDWTISLLEIQPTDHVLEIGFGPGHGIQQVARLATQGRVAGVDFSETMLRQASRRNAAATAEHPVRVRVPVVPARLHRDPMHIEHLVRLIAVEGVLVASSDERIADLTVG